MRRRARLGKENSHRLNERFAKALRQRPDGPLVWLHAASVGESQLHLQLAKSMLSAGYRANLLFTCQTLTAADRINAALEADPTFASVWTCQQMAPIDTASGAKRFLDHWSPDIAIFAEGEIWPNLLTQLDTRTIPAALINARMTDKSISGWRRWPKTSAAIFGTFDVILASNKKTAIGLSEIAQRAIPNVGNLKSALPVPQVTEEELAKFKSLINGRSVLVAASTHEGEEALVLDALIKMTPRPFTVIAPRHPARGDQVEKLLSCSNLSSARRSTEDTVSAATDILLADTMGEMGLWFRLADAVYLGGGHTPGVGGHNPLEPLRLGKPVMTGPSLFNFEDMAKALIENGGLTIVKTVEDIVAAFPGTPPSPILLDKLEGDALSPMTATLKALEPHMQQMSVQK